MDKLDNFKTKFVENSDAIAKIVAENEELTDAQQAQIDSLAADNDKLEKQIETLEKAEKQAASAKRMANRPIPKLDPQVPTDTLGLPNVDNKPFKIPAEARRYGNLKAFKGSPENAYQFGQWFRAIRGVGVAQEFCNNHGIPIVSDVHNEGTNTAGGYLVPPQFDNRIIELVLEYGTFRREAQNIQMTSDTVYRPRRVTGLTASWTAENASASESTKSWDQVSLVAKKLTCLTRISNELREDAIISIADDLAVEMARAFAQAEDTAGWNGTGAAATAGIFGVSPRLSGLYGTTGLGVLDAGATWANTTLAHHNLTMSLLKNWPGIQPKWYCNSTYFHAVMARLAYAAGGNATMNIAGSVVNAFLGKPVVFVESLPGATGNQLSCLYGDLSMAAMFGDRRQTTLAVSDSATVDGESVFERDQIAIRATQRIDINVHSAGTDAISGPIVALRNSA